MVQGPTVTQLKVGELADKTGKTVRALRLYEERGLLTPSRRSQGGFRLYNEKLVDRVMLIDSLQSIGMSLSEIAGLLDVYEGAPTGRHGMRNVRAEYQRRLTDVRARIETLQSVERLLDHGVAFMEGCEPCVHESSACACNGCDRLESAESDLLMVTGMTVN